MVRLDRVLISGLAARPHGVGRFTISSRWVGGFSPLYATGDDAAAEDEEEEVIPGKMRVSEIKVRLI